MLKCKRTSRPIDATHLCFLRKEKGSIQLLGFLGLIYRRYDFHIKIKIKSKSYQNHLLLSHIHLLPFPLDRRPWVPRLNKRNQDEIDFLYTHSTRSSRSTFFCKLRQNGFIICQRCELTVNSHLAFCFLFEAFVSTLLGLYTNH